MHPVFSDARLPPAEIERLRAELARRGLALTVSSAVGSNLTEGPSDPLLLAAHIAFGQPNVADCIRAPHLALIQLTSAGYARYEDPSLKQALAARGAALANASAVYAEPCAQHLLAFMLANARRLPAALAEGPRWRYADLRRESRLLVGQRVLIVGYGAIAARLVGLLAPFRMDIKALRRTVTGREAVRTYPIIAADELLPWADHIVNILPGTDQTRGFFDARKLALIQPTATFYNVGRGTTVSQPALAAALTSGRLAAAYLDVTDPEPLPAGHELWTTPNCHITPHTAGGWDAEAAGLVDHFLLNLDRWRAGEPLVDRIY